MSKQFLQHLTDDNAWKEVSADVTLEVNERRVLATIPLTGTVTITLPHVTEIGDGRFVIQAVRAEGVYSDGSVVVQDQDEALSAAYESDPLTATGDYAVVDAIEGLLWNEAMEKTT